LTERFVGERLEPETGSADTTRLAAGEPGLPRRFTWREGVLEVAGVCRTWRETGPCRHGSGERYVRQHWFEVATASGTVAKLYFERHSRRGLGKGSRWWLFSLKDG